MKVLVTQSCLTLCDHLDCSPPGSSVHGIFKARILEWVAISFSRGSSRLRDRTQFYCFAGRFFIILATREAHMLTSVQFNSVQFSSAIQSCLTLCDPMNRSTQGLPVHHHLPEFIHLTSIESVMPSSHLILGRPLLLLPPIPPSIRVFSSESTLRIRWPKYWSFSFSIILSKEIQG